MNVGVTTIHNHLNYGAVLQAYALTKTVQRLGHICKVIDNNIEPGHGRRFSRSRHPGEQIKNLYMLRHWFAGRRFCQRFEDFFQQHLPKTTHVYKSFDELAASPPEFDAYITGSDQVWNPGLLDRQLGAIYHLGFAASEKSRLISYAPSFGVTQIPERHIERIKTYLLRYHALSIREKRGQEIIQEVTGKRAEHVLDPTLLLSSDDYASITETPSIKGEYILVYPMEVGTNFDFYHLVKAAKKLLSLPIIIIFPLNFHHRWMLLADKIVFDAGPREFLGLIKNSSFVCTNSFHGTVFSILFQKNFLGVPHSHTNTRMYSLLEKLELLERQLVGWDEQGVKAMLHKQINYDEITPRLDIAVKRSLAYLQKGLEI